MKKIIVGITDCSRYPNYEKWITDEPGVDVIRLSYRDNNFQDIKKCHGILLTGGEDVHPKFYNKPEYSNYCEKIDEERDQFEKRVIEYSQEKELPVLGICRGLQIANVFFGGQLIPDILHFKNSNHTKDRDSDKYHDVQVKKDSLLREIVGVEKGEINSAHHQSADKIGADLAINATSNDGIIEGLERKDAGGKPFLLLVQWHPERMKDQSSMFSKNIKKSFLQAVRNNS
jgi:putative glutamine amidotransferase